jgi:hypothetical protein
MKDWYKSRTLWVNVIAIANIILRAKLGLTLTPEAEVGILVIINFVLRYITKEKIVFKK